MSRLGCNATDVDIPKLLAVLKPLLAGSDMPTLANVTWSLALLKQLDLELSKVRPWQKHELDGKRVFIFPLIF